MMKKIFAVAGRDLKSGLRDAIILYALLFPVVAAVILRFFIPAASSVSIRFIATDETPPALVSFLEDYGKVEQVKDREALDKRVMQNDDVVGISPGEEGYRIVLEGNEPEGFGELASAILLSYENPGMPLPVTVGFDDIGWFLSPMSQYGATLLIVMLAFLTGILIAFNVVEDKQFNTLSAINVTPISKFQYVAGKSLLGFVIPLMQAYVVLWILDVFYVNKGMVVVMVFASCFIGVILGFLNGVSNKDTMSAVSSMKATMFPLLLGMLGGIFLNEKWHFLLYWNPFYWSYNAIDKMVKMTATWGDILISSGAILLITALVFLAIRKKIMRGLA
ncbi:MAG: ABC transporter permease [Clostridia bacterium]